MTPEQTLLLLRYVRACCPQQAIDKYTPDAWHDLLGDLDFAEARAAVAEVAKRQPFVAPAEIRAEVRAVRDRRLDEAGVPAPPPQLLDDPEAYNAHLRATTRRIASEERPLRAVEGS